MCVFFSCVLILIKEVFLNAFLVKTGPHTRSPSGECKIFHSSMPSNNAANVLRNQLGWGFVRTSFYFAKFLCVHRFSLSFERSSSPVCWTYIWRNFCFGGQSPNESCSLFVMMNPPLTAGELGFFILSWAVRF